MPVPNQLLTLLTLAPDWVLGIRWWRRETEVITIIMKLLNKWKMSSVGRKKDTIYNAVDFGSLRSNLDGIVPMIKNKRG